MQLDLVEHEVHNKVETLRIEPRRSQRVMVQLQHPFERHRRQAPYPTTSSPWIRTTSVAEEPLVGSKARASTASVTVILGCGGLTSMETTSMGQNGGEEEGWARRGIWLLAGSMLPLLACGWRPLWGQEFIAGSQRGDKRLVCIIAHRVLFCLW